MFSWDPNISLGSVVTVVIFLVSLLSLHISNVRRFEEVKAKLDVIYRWWERHISDRTNK